MSDRTSSSSEYKKVLESVTEALLQATRDQRLPDLNPDQIHFWLTNLNREDVFESWRNVMANHANPGEDENTEDELLQELKEQPKPEFIEDEDEDAA